MIAVGKTALRAVKRVRVGMFEKPEEFSVARHELDQSKHCHRNRRKGAPSENSLDILDASHALNRHDE